MSVLTQGALVPKERGTWVIPRVRRTSAYVCGGTTPSTDFKRRKVRTDIRLTDNY
ncbi:hypothetical protein DPMN_120871 [Dreissena polymorpha]|uniref:Uncharacterized protein n=1 Tax=Dreissena polymorpha TaxID=45954 RepID=A0A9D4JSK1_DREPO|nr:hypothetical protein DPMN_120871 [Dreissena polymorpha]